MEDWLQNVSMQATFHIKRYNKEHQEADFKEFERRLKFKPRLKYGWFHLKSYLKFQHLSRHLIETGGRI